MTRQSKPGLLFETLEQRLLLAGDLAALHAGPASLDLTLTLDLEAQAIVVLDNNQGGLEIERHDLRGTDKIAITGSKGNDRFTIQLDPGSVDLDRITVNGGRGNDSIFGPDLGSDWSLDKGGKVHVGNVSIQNVEHLVGSASGYDTLSGPDKKAVWIIDGHGNGMLGKTSFTGFEHLQGSDRAKDTFVVLPMGGSTADHLLNDGTVEVDGGDGAKRDRLLVKGNHFLEATLTKSGAGAGTFELDGMNVSLKSTEDIDLRAVKRRLDVIGDVSITFNASDDNETITVADASSSQISIVASNTSDSTTFARPSSSLTINAGGDTASVTLNSITLPGADLTVVSGDPGVDDLNPLPTSSSLSVMANSTINTSANTGRGGDITLKADSIEIGAGADVLALFGSGPGGSVTLTADNRREATGFIFDELTNNIEARTASITLDDGTTISAANITIQALAGDRSLDNSMSDYADGAPEGVLKILEDAQSLIGIPVSVLVKRSAADIDITGAVLFATGAITVDANAESDGIGTGTFFRSPGNIPGGLAFVYVQTDASATVEISDSTIEAQTGDISVTSEGTTNASGTARVSQNFGRQGSPTNPQNVQTAASVGYVNLTSTISLDPQTDLVAGAGDVNVAATGTSSNEPSSETESYKDGLVGLTLGLALSNAKVEVSALGKIESGGTSTVTDNLPAFNPFTAIDPVKGTIAVDTTAGYKTGDAVVYNADSGGPAKGLVDQQTYFVIVVDATHFELAATRADALAGTAITLGALPALEIMSGQQNGFSQVQESTSQIIFDYDPGLQVGQQVYYDPAAAQHITGLSAKNKNDPSTLYTVAAVGQSAGGGQWLVTLHDAKGGSLVLNLDPTLTDANGIAYAFSLAGSAVALLQAQPGFATGASFTYQEALGLHIPTLTDGQTYYLVKDPDDTTNTVFRLATSQANATSSDGFSDTVALGHADTNVTTGNQHWLQAVNSGGVSITAQLNTTEEAETKSGQGGEPESSDAASKGELLPVIGSIIKNISSLATLPLNQDGSMTNPMDNQIAANAPAGSGSNTDFGLAATLAFDKSSNDAKVQIGGTITSNAGLTVDADITHQIQTQAEAVKSPTQAGDTSVTIAGAGGVGLSYDNAQIIIDAAAKLDASGAMSMSATVTYPFMAPLDSPSDFFTYVLNQFASNPLSTISGLLGNVFLIKQDLVNSWVRSADNDTNAKVSIAGAVDFQSRNAFATVDVMGGAQINQNADFRSTEQSVSLSADTGMQMINVGGIFDYDLSPEGLIKAYRSGPSNAIQPYGAQGGKVGFGGAYRQLDLATTTHAIIHGLDAKGVATAVYTGPSENLSVSAENDVFILGVTQSGTAAGQFGISGSAAFTHQTTDTIAAIESGAVINAGSGDVQAAERTVLPTYSGDVVKGKNLGFGVSLVYNDINRDTQAYVGDVTGVSTAASNMTFGVGLVVQAHTDGRYFGFALASATADNQSTPPNGSNSSAPPDPNNPLNNTSVNSSPPPSTGNYGVAVSGDVVFNQVTDVTQAIVDDAGRFAAASLVIVTATDDTEILGITGSAAIAEGGNSSLGLAGSYSENRLITTTAAEINRATLTKSSDSTLSVGASQGGFVTAVAAGGSGGINHADSSSEVAGSVAINVATPTTVARIDGATITNQGDLSVTADDKTPIYALAGAASFGGKQGFGAAVATNVTNWTSPVTGDKYGEAVAAQIVNSTITQTGTGTGTLSVAASIEDPSSTQDRIVAVAGSLGQGSSVGVSGTVAVNDLGVPSGNAVEASITGSTIKGATGTSSGVSVSAEVDQTIITVGGEVALATGSSSTFALGAGVAFVQSDLPVQAFIDNSDVTALALSINADIGGSASSVSAGVAIANNAAAVAGSAGVNVIGDQVGAFIDGLSASQAIRVTGATTIAAANRMSLTAAAGELAAGTNAAGASVAINDISTTTVAYIGGATVTTGGVVEVTADTIGKVQSVAVGAVGGANFALGGSVAITVADTQTLAYTEGANIKTPGSVKIAADSSDTFITAAGTLVAVAQFDPGTGAVGIANATLVRKDKTQAWASAGSIDFGGTGAALDVKSAASGAVVDTPAFTGLSLTATSTDHATTAAGGGALTIETVGAAGSATVTVLEKSTDVTVWNSLTLPSTQGATNINLLASDDSQVSTGAGGLGFGDNGIGAGVDAVSITKDTETRFEPTGTVNISGNLAVQALSSENLLSVAVGAGFGGELSIAGAASAYVLDLQTFGVIGNTGVTPQITAGGSVLLAAQDDTVINQFPGGLSIGGSTGIGAAVAVVDVKTKWVEAIVFDGVSITAHANSSQPTLAAATGEFQVAFNAPSETKGDVQPPNIHVNVGKQTGDSAAPALSNGNLARERQADPVFQETRGIAVSAINTAVVKALTFAVGGAGTAAVNIDANVDVINMATNTRIGGGAVLASDGDVVLASGADVQKMGITGSAAVSGSGSGAAGVDVTTISMDTATYLYGAPNVPTRISAGTTRDVIVNSQAQEDVLGVTASFAAGGGAGLDAGATVVKIDNSTFAGVFSGAVEISAGGNVLVDAADDTIVGAITGQGAVGILGGAFGGATVVTLITKDTNAIVNTDSTIDALAQGDGSLTVLDGSVASGNTGLEMQTIQGVAIQATSSETVEAVAVGAAGGFYVGAGAGVTVTVIDSDTNAHVNPNVAINQAPGGSVAQAVSVVAGNVVDVLTVGGGLGVGAGGIGGGIDVGTIRNDTSVLIYDGANVNAKGAVDVAAVSLISLESYALSAGLGAVVGVTGSVSVWTIGTGVDSNYSDSNVSANALTFNKGSGANTSVPASADAQTQRTDVTTLLGAYTNTGGANASQITGVVGGASSDYVAAQPNGVVAASFSDTSTSGVSAAVWSGASISAGTFDMSATTLVLANQTSGGVSTGVGSVGASVNVLNRGDTTTAAFDGSVNVGGTVDVTALSGSIISSKAYGGEAGELVLGAQVTVVNDSTTVSASIGPDAVVTHASQSLAVGAGTTKNITTNVMGIDVGLVGAGAGVSMIKITGGTAAQLASKSVSAGSVAVTASSETTASATSKASGGGVIANAVSNVSALDITPTVLAAIDGGSGAVLNTTGTVLVEANSNVNGTTTANGYDEGVGISIGVSIAKATTNGTADAHIGTGNTVNAGGAVMVRANASDNLLADATANAGFSLINGTAGALATATITNQTSAYILGDVTANGDIQVLAQHPSANANASANGVVGSSAVVVGYDFGNAIVTSTVLAYIDQGTVKTTGSGDITVAATEGLDDAPTGPISLATASEGFYSGGDSLASSATTTYTPTVRAFIGNPLGAGTATNASLSSAGDLNVTAGSWTVSAPQALTGPNQSFIANSSAEADATATKVTEAYLGLGAHARASGTATIAATSVEDLSPLAAGYDGDALNAQGTATTNVYLSRVTHVDIGAGATLDAGAIVLGAQSTTSSEPDLNDNDSNDAHLFNTVFHAGVDDSLAGEATSVSTFNIGSDKNNNATNAGSSIFIEGALTAPTISMTAHTTYAINVNSFAWVTAGAATAKMDADGTVTTQDDVIVQFSDTGTAAASQSVALNAGFSGSAVSVFTKLHYSENVQPIHSNTNATTNLNANVSLIDNDDLSAVTSPHITSGIDTATGQVTNWDMTVTNGNDHASFGHHDLHPNSSIEGRNDWSDRTSSGVVEPLMLSIDPATGWIIQGEYADAVADNDWIELSADASALPSSAEQLISWAT